ncbi:type II toxin-antitoxin system HipA family toxin [Ideonella sp.]|jgi:serine/threonine-protein kinase HipA|uniref:type II toxin-antitoxin system HipA family toxin n=1 Tax=Ideonella sp. TaxID=1929293 RepID=UPI0037BEC1CF
MMRVHTPEGISGLLAKEEVYRFAYSAQRPPNTDISLTMPGRLQSYDSPQLHPIFQMNMPEGYLLERLRHRLAKLTGTDPLQLISAMACETSIGRVRLTPAERDQPEPSSPPMRLDAILTYRGAEGLFQDLMDRYMMRAPLSGVQPKVLVPEAVTADTMAAPAPKAAALTPDLIVKSGLSDFPGLAINEFVCMSIARAAGMPGPEFYLSDDRQIFVIRRFDRDEAGAPLGFEDMAVLSGRGADQKYTGSYEMLAKLVRMFASEERVEQSLRELFDIVALSCIVGNGDAHLKNFGMLHSAGGTDVRLAPAYDIVCTTCYLPDDALALNLDGNKSIFAARLGLLKYMETCGLTRKQGALRIGEIADAALKTLSLHGDLAGEVSGLAKRIKSSAETYRMAFAK